MNHAFFVMVGLILGNSVTPIVVSLFVKTKKHWDVRHAFEIGLANMVYALLLATIVLTTQLTTGLFTKTGIFLTNTLAGYELIEYLPAILNLMVSPVVYVLRIDQWPMSFSLVFTFVLLVWSFRTFGDSVVRYYGGVSIAQKRLKGHLESKWKVFSIGCAISLIIPSASLLVSLLVPLSAKNILTLRQAIPYIIATNIATYLDVLIIAFANGSPAAIAGALVLFLICAFGVLLMTERLGIQTILKITRFFTIRLIPQKKRYIAVFLGVYALVPVILFGLSFIVNMNHS